MRIFLHIGVEHCGAARLQSVLAAQRDALNAQNVLYAQSPGHKAHTRLWMAVTDPDHVDLLRAQRGFADPSAQAALREAVLSELRAEIAAHRPDALILSAAQLCWLRTPDEVARLRDLLAPLSNDIRICAHVDEQAAVLARLYGTQVLNGRAEDLRKELSLARMGAWWEKADRPQDPERAVFTEIQASPFWLDYGALVALWDGAFGSGATRLLPYSEPDFAAPDISRHISDAFELAVPLSPAPEFAPAALPSEMWLAKARAMNHLLRALRANTDKTLPRQLWRSILDGVYEDGPALDPARLAPISRAFADANAGLLKAHPALEKGTFARPRAKKLWQEPVPGRGFRASQVLLTHMWQIERATRQQMRKVKTFAPRHTREDTPPLEISDAARAVMPPQAIEAHSKLIRSPFIPHNRMGTIDEETPAPAYSPLKPRDLGKSSGNVIVGCMKNEAPYILEWIAYHRAIGVDHFLIYTNGCEDGTADILDRLQALGIVEHRNNDDWKGNSPQQHALNCALKEPVIKAAEWIIHIDVDEFINVRCGNGSLADLFAAVPNATNIAMTWRIFGHSSVDGLQDAFVIEQFDHCAPKFCPKPHTVWGFKTMMRNIGAYGKISCHRPNKLDPARAGEVKWVNGSGRDMTSEAAERGWRNSHRSVGYDLVQLNHYALRSVESFLIKRQRGRALHVDRTIGLNYWIRMDWNEHRDLSIQRNLPRMRLAYDLLMEDPQLAALHRTGHDWHRAKADDLHTNPEFQELYANAKSLKLNDLERAAYTLALDMES